MAVKVRKEEHACDNCHRDYLVDLLIPDKLWKRICPDPKHPDRGWLCMECIGDRLEGLGQFGALHIGKIGGFTKRHEPPPFNWRAGDDDHHIGDDFVVPR